MKWQNWENSKYSKPQFEFLNKGKPETDLRLQATKLAHLKRMEFEESINDFDRVNGFDVVGMVIFSVMFWTIAVYAFLG